MKSDDLHNAAVIAENHEDVAFLAEGNLLHAVEKHVADLQSEKNQPELVLPLMRKALQALLKYAAGKVPPPVTYVDLHLISLKPDEQDQLIEKIVKIYSHLPRFERNELSSLIHHKQLAGKGN